jgi:sugar fermentation stimulation protein A
MKYPELLPGRLVKRYKRFLADVELENGETITAHCPNTGSMLNCCDPGSRVWLLDSDNPKRKLRYTLELVEVDKQYLACINTNRANHLVKEAILDCRIEGLAGYDELLTERPYGVENSRVDILLKKDGLADCYVEVKNVTLLTEDGVGLFPDAVTERGRKHLRELINVAKDGNRAVLFFNVAHTGIQQIAPAWDIDSNYSTTLQEAVDHGVEIMAYQTSISLDAIVLEKQLEFHMNNPASKA